MTRSTGGPVSIFARRVAASAAGMGPASTGTVHRVTVCPVELGFGVIEAAISEGLLAAVQPGLETRDPDGFDPLQQSP